LGADRRARVADGGMAPGRDFLGKLQATFPYGRERQQALFGRPYQTLEFDSEDAAWVPVHDLVGGYSRLPRGSGVRQTRRPADPAFGADVVD
jgi:hypothetical protein